MNTTEHLTHCRLRGSSYYERQLTAGQWRSTVRCCFQNLRPHGAIGKNLLWPVAIISLSRCSLPSMQSRSSTDYLLPATASTFCEHRSTNRKPAVQIKLVILFSLLAFLLFSCPSFLFCPPDSPCCPFWPQPFHSFVLLILCVAVTMHVPCYSILFGT